MSVERVLTNMEAAVKVAEQQKAAIDPLWTEAAKKAKIAEIDGWLAGRMAELRTEADAGIASERAEAAAKDYKRRMAVGPTSAQYSEAFARAGFIAADVAAMRPEEIPAAYQKAKAAGDLVGAWLIERAGQDRLEAMRKQINAGEEPPAPVVQAAEALHKAAWADLDAKASAERKAIDELQAKVLSARNRGHRPDVRINF